MVRGGSFHFRDGDFDDAFHCNYSQDRCNPTFRYSYLGFRCAYDGKASVPKPVSPTPRRGWPLRDIKKRSTSLAVRSSNRTLEEGFRWAADASLSHVQTGEPGCIPCYQSGLLDRGHFCIRDFSHQATAAHLLGLDRENLEMLRAFARTSTQAREWWPLWILGLDGEMFHMDYHHDGYFVRETPMVFDLVETGRNLLLWTGDQTYLNDPKLWSYYTHAMVDFVTLHDHFGDGIASTEGLYNWPYRGIATYGEGEHSLAQGADSVACQYDATIAYAQLLARRGAAAQAQEFRRRAASIKELFNREWLDSERGYASSRLRDRSFSYKLGETGLLTRGLIDRGPAADRLLDDNEATLPRGILRAVEGRCYLPEAYFSAGRSNAAWSRMIDLLDIHTDYPEVSFTWVSDVILGILGVSVDADGALVTRPHLPDDIDYCDADNIPLGGHRISVRQERGGRTLVRHTDGPGPLKWAGQPPLNVGDSRQIQPK